MASAGSGSGAPERGRAEGLRIAGDPVENLAGFVFVRHEALLKPLPACFYPPTQGNALQSLTLTVPTIV